MSVVRGGGGDRIGVGRSPSGKAPEFGSGTRRFESFPPSQFLFPRDPQDVQVVIYPIRAILF